MTREVEIKKASEVFVHDVENAGDRLLLEVGFRHGVLWADEHPKNPWRDVEKELPKARKLKGKSKYVLTISKDGDLVVARYDTINKRWCNFKTYFATPSVWMPIPELTNKNN